MPKADTSPVARFALGALILVGVGVSGFWLVKAGVIYSNPESEWVAPLPVQTAQINRVNTPPLDTRFDAFHRSATVEALPAAIGEDAPETTLNITLKGHRAGPNGSATIQTPDRQEKNYYIGDEIMSGVTLEAVNPGFAVIRRSTGLERLSNKREELFGRTEEEANNGSASVVQTAGNRPDPLAARRAQGSGSGQKPNISAISAGDLLRSVSLDRVMEGQKVKGYRVTARSGTDLSDFGLRSGDIITHINGEDMTQGRPDLSALMTEMGQRNSASLILLRNDAPITVRIGN
jgi:general secretion pathway protein C